MSEGLENVGLPGPREGRELIGHKEAESLLRHAFESGRMAHAWLISGPRGVGKASLAYRATRWVLAGGGSNDAEDEGPGLFGDAIEPIPATGEGLHLDPEHPVFRLVANGAHPDLYVLERGYDDKNKRLRREIVVDDVRAMGHFLRRTSTAGGWRVVVIDSADEMNRNAANAVLKLLEEPPKRTLMLLVSHAPGRLLPTIRSRCRMLRLAPLAHDGLVELLRRDDPDAPPDELQSIAGMAEGSVGRALSIKASDGLGHLKDILAMIEHMPSLDTKRLYALADTWARAPAKRKSDEEGNGARDRSDPFAAATEILFWWLGRAIRRTASGEREGEIVPGENKIADRMIDRLGRDGVDRKLTDIAQRIGRGDALNLQRKQLVIDAFLELAA